MRVLVTGATSGIGKATATLFAREGHDLIITGRRNQRLQALSETLRQDFGTNVVSLCFDVRNVGACEAALATIPDSNLVVDVLINNAGLALGLEPFHQADVIDWETMIDTNVKGLLYMTRLISPDMVSRGTGHIINVCSTAGHEVYAKGHVYCASKHAVNALTKGMRLDLHKYGIRVSQVSPAHVEETEFAPVRFHGDLEKARIYEDFQPLKASDVAETIYFIATRPAHVNIQDVVLMGTQQASSTVIDRSGRKD